MLAGPLEVVEERQISVEHSLSATDSEKSLTFCKNFMYFVMRLGCRSKFSSSRTRLYSQEDSSVHSIARFVSQ
jgi:hypothetical protein